MKIPNDWFPRNRALRYALVRGVTRAVEALILYILFVHYKVKPEWYMVPVAVTIHWSLDFLFQKVWTYGGSLTLSKNFLELAAKFFSIRAVIFTTVMLTYYTLSEVLRLDRGVVLGVMAFVGPMMLVIAFFAYSYIFSRQTPKDVVATLTLSLYTKIKIVDSWLKKRKT